MTVEALAAHLSEATANLDAYIDARAQVLAEELMRPIRAELVEAEQGIEFEIKRREDLGAEFRRQMLVMERRAETAEAEVQGWRTTADLHQQYWRGEHLGYCQGCHDLGVLVLSPCPTRKGGEDAIAAAKERQTKRVEADRRHQERMAANVD